MIPIMKPGPKRDWVITATSAKRCNVCLTVKPISDFQPHKRCKFNVVGTCKKCVSAKNKAKYETSRPEILVKAAEYRAANAQKVKFAKQRCYHKRREHYLRKTDEWWSSNRERYNANERARRKRRWQEIRPARAAAQRRHYHRKKSDRVYALGRSVSQLIAKSLSLGKQGRSWRHFVPYSLDELKRHLERQFQSGMTWDNYGPVWHLDHVVPRSSFKIKSADCPEFKACWALSNLRPLWALDNIRKQATRTHLL